jgi:hypothetical protein
MQVTYGGTSIEKQQNVGTISDFEFQTGSITSTSCTKYRYDWEAWKPVNSPLELLPKTAKFRDSDGPDTTATPVAGSNTDLICS